MNEEKNTSAMQKLDRASNMVSKLMMSVCVFIFVVMVLSVSYGVLGRYIPFIKKPRWTQELAILCMVWLCFVGAGLAIKEGLHVRMNVLDVFLPKKVCAAMHMLSYVLLLVVNLGWIYYGSILVTLTKTARMSATGWPMSLTYLSVVVGGIYGAVMALYRLIKGGW